MSEAADQAAAQERTPRRPLPTWLVVLIALLVSVLIRVLLPGIYAIPTGSMDNTTVLGDRVAVAKWRGGDVLSLIHI